MTTKTSPSKRDRPPGGSGISGGGGTAPFFGRQDELDQFEAELRDPRGDDCYIFETEGATITRLLRVKVKEVAAMDQLLPLQH